MCDLSTGDECNTLTVTRAGITSPSDLFHRKHALPECCSACQHASFGCDALKDAHQPNQCGRSRREESPLFSSLSALKCSLTRQNWKERDDQSAPDQPAALRHGGKLGERPTLTKVRTGPCFTRPRDHSFLKYHDTMPVLRPRPQLISIQLLDIV